MAVNYPGKRAAEAAVTPAARVLATHIVRGRIIDAAGWWFLRQHGSRAELVERGLVKRATSYSKEALVEELFGKPVEQLSLDDVLSWLGLAGDED